MVQFLHSPKVLIQQKLLCVSSGEENIQAEMQNKAVTRGRVRNVEEDENHYRSTALYHLAIAEITRCLLIFCVKINILN